LGENRSHLCILKILGYFGLDPPKRGSGLVGNKLISVQTSSSPLPEIPGIMGQPRGETKEINLE